MGAIAILVVVNSILLWVQAGWVNLDLDFLGLAAGDTFEVMICWQERSYSWQGSRNYVDLRPAEVPAHIFRVVPAGERFRATTVVTIKHEPSREAGLKKPGSTADPLWYKDAIIYELHVKAFMDGNNDGIGDFQG